MMNRQQFRVLYREFLFRMVDLEVLSAQGDIKQLLGQFGSILIFFGALVALGAMFFDPRRMTAGSGFHLQSPVNAPAQSSPLYS